MTIWEFTLKKPIYLTAFIITPKYTFKLELPIKKYS